MQLFESLLSKLGQEDFLFAVLAMLATKYGMDKDVLATMTSLASKVGAELQLIVSTSLNFTMEISAKFLLDICPISEFGSGCAQAETHSSAGSPRRWRRGRKRFE